MKVWRHRTLFASGKLVRAGILMVRLKKYGLVPETGVPSLAALLLHGLYGLCSRVAYEISMQ